jgi:hypothetical protein
METVCEAGLAGCFDSCCALCADVLQPSLAAVQQWAALAVSDVV